MIECTILGPLSAQVAGGPIPLGPPRHQKILAMLLLNVGQIVTLPRLICALWPDHPPGSAREQVHNGVSALRRKLTLAGAAGDMINTSFVGIVLRRASVDVDLHRADALIAAARQAIDHCVAAAHLRNAVDLWSGPCLAGLTGPWFESAAVALEERRLMALEQCIQHELEVLPAQDLVAELTGLVADFPLRESFTRQLMLALHRSCRQADALAVYRCLRNRLHDELGIEPSRAVADLEIAILRLEPALTS